MGLKIATLLKSSETDNVQRRRTGRIPRLTATDVIDPESRLTFLFGIGYGRTSTIQKQRMQLRDARATPEAGLVGVKAMHSGAGRRYALGGWLGWN